MAILQRIGHLTRTCQVNRGHTPDTETLAGTSLRLRRVNFNIETERDFSVMLVYGTLLVELLGWRVGGRLRAPCEGLRKLHPLGGSVALRGVGREVGYRRRKIPPPAVDDDALALRRLAGRVKSQPTL